MLAPVAMKKGTIIIIDDDPVGLETLAEGLQEEGYTALPAPDGQSGLSLLLAGDIIDNCNMEIRMRVGPPHGGDGQTHPDKTLIFSTISLV